MVDALEHEVRCDPKFAAGKEGQALLDLFKAQVGEVHKEMNSMKDQLVLTTEKEALARGGVEERARAEKRNEDKRNEDKNS